MSGLLDGLDVVIGDVRDQWFALVKRDDVRDLLRSEGTRAQVIAAIPHADWCCTKGCVEDWGMHRDVEFHAAQPILVSEYPCPGDCTCEVGMIVPGVLAALVGDDQ